ncbi:hypothetical protein Afil01_61900 [Actinorhabdospora filicis]|uniref:Uncharacterized protein n=1 Tax=Actinorhabdospora filicis TaxID=1785913 RepID=A0A9W6WCS6_9ACTN|nr:hypothetical protein [Actinorhabdospora filicis]GLZ81383.1 hypothetical protein Afil01_61900 [Actinorhabdospora filicis]
MYLPEIPSIAPDLPVAEIYFMHCRTCDAHGPWVGALDYGTRDHLWDLDHRQATGHTKFYRWSVTRQTADII